MTPLTSDDLKEVVDVLCGLEAVIGRLAAERLDPAGLRTVELLHQTMLRITSTATDPLTSG